MLYINVYQIFIYLQRNRFIVQLCVEWEYCIKIQIKISSGLIKSDLWDPRGTPVGPLWDPHCGTPAVRFSPVVTGSDRRTMRCTSAPQWRWCRRSRRADPSSTATAHKASTLTGTKWSDPALSSLRLSYSGTWGEALQRCVFYRK